MDVQWYINALLVDRSRSDRSKRLSSLWPFIIASTCCLLTSTLTHDHSFSVLITDYIYTDY